MKLMNGMVFSGLKSPDTYNEIVRIYKRDDGKKMIDVLQFGKTDEDKPITFFEKEIQYALRKGIAFIVNNWESRN